MTNGDVASLLKELYEGETQPSRRFSYGILIFDIATVLFIIVTSFFKKTAAVELIDVLISIVLLTEFSARIWMSQTRLKEPARSPIDYYTTDISHYL
jgi:voltage-gated potassium channel